MKQILVILSVWWTLLCGAKVNDHGLQVEAMYDSDGKQINCHGGGLLTVDDTTYWYGEHRPGLDATYQMGVSCYATTDFRTWHNKGIVMAVSNDTTSDIRRGCTIERPKVVRCPSTGKYVMWFHLELAGQGYNAARCAVAISDTPTGPFRFVRSGRVNAGHYPVNMPASLRGKHTGDSHLKWWTNEWYTAVTEGMLTERDMEGGQMSRDMTVFVDEDGQAYHIYSSEENLTLHIAVLTPDYTAHTGRYIRIFPTGHNEAPVIFKHDGRYWMVTSGCTGWKPNKARMMWADSIMGEWHMMDETPCVGDGSDTTFDGQGTFCANILGQLVFMADQWRPKCLGDSRNLWLPIHFRPDGTPYITRGIRD